MNFLSRKNVVSPTHAFALMTQHGFVMRVAQKRLCLVWWNKGLQKFFCNRDGLYAGVFGSDMGHMSPWYKMRDDDLSYLLSRDTLVKHLTVPTQHNLFIMRMRKFHKRRQAELAREARNPDRFIFTQSPTTGFNFAKFYLGRSMPKPYQVIDGLKYDDKKERWDLLPMDAIAEAVKRYTHGATKYKPNSWQNLEDGRERYYAALLRHLTAWRAGEIQDPDAPELTHLSAVLWNAIALVWFDLHKDDK